MHARAEARPSTRLRDRAFRETLQQCEDSCQAVGLVSFALALSPEAGADADQLHECWRTAIAVASVLAHFDRHDASATLAMLDAGERCASRLAELVERTSAPPTWGRIGELARDCARLCAVLARWLDKGSA